MAHGLRRFGPEPRVPCIKKCATTAQKVVGRRVLGRRRGILLIDLLLPRTMMEEPKAYAYMGTLHTITDVLLSRLNEHLSSFLGLENRTEKFEQKK